MQEDLKFSGIERLLGKEEASQIRSIVFVVIGLGGVGSWAAEALVRSGISKLKLVDLDEVCVSNFNRQLQAIETNIGKSKIKSLAQRFQEINPRIEIDLIEDFYSEDSAELILNGADVVIDAIDSLGAKCHLALKCREKKIPLIVAGGAGGKKDPSRIKITDLSKTKNDPLLQKLRKKLRRDYNFPRGDKKFHISTVYSDELPQIAGTCEKPAGSLDCDSGFGTASYITGSFGFFCAYEALRLSLKPAKSL